MKNKPFRLPESPYRHCERQAKQSPKAARLSGSQAAITAQHNAIQAT
ncbi:MAG: hypothetical protein IKI11_10010 [Neisseriaceae bacterium]|nr:hypothetical protein [Neisseriaceae bacterium]MBR7002978.1 hypothetical protein [Neisseriaceae bacterium]